MKMRTAKGQMIDVEALRLQSENTIAVGNMKVNARGDELGPGGKIVRTREQVMADYYKLQSPSNTVKTAAQKEAEAMSKLSASEASAAPAELSETAASVTNKLGDLGMDPSDAEMEPDISEEELAAMKAKDTKKFATMKTKDAKK